MEDSVRLESDGGQRVKPFGTQVDFWTQSKTLGESHLLGALLDGFLELAMDRLVAGSEETLFERAEDSADGRLATLASVADAAVAALDDQLHSTEERARECVESLERARREPLLRDLAVENWALFFRTSVSPQKILAQLLERHAAALEKAPSEEERERAVLAFAQNAIFLTSLTSQLKTHLEKIFREDALLAWMCEWGRNKRGDREKTNNPPSLITKTPL